jgi:hypothetical protein
MVKTVAMKFMSRDLSRMLFNTVIWYFSTSSFNWFNDLYGSCSDPNKGRTACVRAGYVWRGFDISGHTFILIFSTLLILEEVSVMIGWEPFGHQLSAHHQHLVKTKQTPNRQHLAFEKRILPIRGLFFLLTVLTLIWDYMLIQTALFYHSMIQKLIAAVWALVVWFVAYKIIYPAHGLRSVVKPPSKPVFNNS